MDAGTTGSSELGSEFLQAFAIGLLVLAVFSWQQLNRPSYESGEARRRARLLKLLAPKDLRSGSVFVRAYLFYFFIFAMIYTVLCFGGATIHKLVSIASLATDIGGYDPQVNAFRIDDPAWPFAVSMALVGLSPAIPWISRVEERIRYLAHRLVGIPESVFAQADALSRVHLDPSRLPLSSAAKRDVERHVQAASEVLDKGPATDRFANALLLIHTYRELVLTAEVWPSPSVRQAYRKLEEEVKPEIFALLDDLEDMRVRPASVPAWHRPPAHIEGDHDAEPTSRDRKAALDTAERRWSRIVERGFDTDYDICAILSLFLEASRLPRERPHELVRTRSELTDEAARSALRELFDAAATERRVSRTHLDLLVIVVGGMSLAMYVCGYAASLLGLIDYSAAAGVDGTGHAQIAVMYLIGTIATYALASLVAATYRESKIDRRAWTFAFRARQPLPAVQYLWVFVLGYLASAVSLVGLGAAEYFGNPREVSGVLDRFLASDLLPDQLTFALLGAVHATFLILAFDRAAALAAGSDHVPRFALLPALHGAGLGLAGYFISISNGYDVTTSSVHAGLSALFGVLAAVVTQVSLDPSSRPRPQGASKSPEPAA